MKRSFLLITVFLTGLAVMAVEMTGSRLLAPYFGSSFFIWTNLIGIVLLALSLGYYFGGRWADRWPEAKLKKRLYQLILATGILVTLIPLLAKPIFQGTAQLLSLQTGSVFWVSLLSILLLFSFPLFLFGMVTPWATRLALYRAEGAGQVIGSIYALSTLGSLIGTFLPVLLTVPYIGSRWTFFLLGALLIALGVLGLSRPLWSLALLVPLFAGAVSMPGERGAHDKVLFEGESIYQHLRVERQIIRLGEGLAEAKVLMVNEGLGAQSIYQEQQLLTGYYWDQAAIMPLFNPQGRKMLILGLAGGTSALLAKNLYPGLQVEGVEIDPLVADLARRYFGLTEEKAKIHVQDGRVFIQQSPEKYDFILVDVFRDGAFIPFHLATKEFFSELRRHLNPGGLVWMNLHAPAKDSPIAATLEQSLRAEFPAVYAYWQGDVKSMQLWAFEAAPTLDSQALTAARPEVKALAMKVTGQWQAVTPLAKAPLSTDDNSILEILSGKLVFSQKVNAEK